MAEVRHGARTRYRGRTSRRRVKAPKPPKTKTPVKKTTPTKKKEEKKTEKWYQNKWLRMLGQLGLNYTAAAYVLGDWPFNEGSFPQRTQTAREVATRFHESTIPRPDEHSRAFMWNPEIEGPRTRQIYHRPDYRSWTSEDRSSMTNPVSYAAEVYRLRPLLYEDRAGARIQSNLREALMDVRDPRPERRHRERYAAQRAIDESHEEPVLVAHNTEATIGQYHVGVPMRDHISRQPYREMDEEYRRPLIQSYRRLGRLANMHDAARVLGPALQRQRDWPRNVFTNQPAILRPSIRWHNRQLGAPGQ